MQDSLLQSGGSVSLTTRMDSQRNQFWEMVKPEYQPLYRFCCRLTGSDDDGADLCQDVLLRAKTHFGQLNDPTSFKPWLYRIAVNEFKSRIKRPWWARVIPISDSLIAGLSGGNPLPRHQASRILRIGFRGVSAEDQALLIMFELEGFSMNDLSKMTGQSEPATRMRLSRIRERIRKRLIKQFRSENKNGQTVNSLLSEDEICVATKPGLD